MAPVSLRLGRGGFSHTAEADGIPRETGILEAGRFADPARGAKLTQLRVPGTAAEDVLVAFIGARRMGGGTMTVVVLAVDIVAPLGHVAVHIVPAPGIRLLPADGMGLLVRVLREPGIVAELARIVAEEEIRAGVGPTGVFPLGLRRQAIAVSREVALARVLVVTRLQVFGP